MAQLSGDVDLHYKLSHPIRRKIMTLLHERSGVSYSELRGELQINAGRLYYHIDILGEFLMQGDDRRYRLSPIGKQAYEFILEGNPFSPTPALVKLPALFLILQARPIFQALLLGKAYSLLSSIVVLIAGFTIVVQAGLMPVSLYFSTIPGLFPPTLLGAAFLGSILLEGAFYSLVSWILLKRLLKALPLLVGLSISQLPLLGFLTISKIAGLLPTFNVLAFVVFFLLQLWAVAMRIGSLTVAGEMPVQRAALFVFLYLYVNVLLVGAATSLMAGLF